MMHIAFTQSQNKTLEFMENKVFGKYLNSLGSLRKEAKILIKKGKQKKGQRLWHITKVR